MQKNLLKISKLTSYSIVKNTDNVNDDDDEPAFIILSVADKNCIMEGMTQEKDSAKLRGRV